MTDLAGIRVVVAGGGAVGSAVALAVRGAGAEVVLADPARLGDNASGVAAGMLAPAFEAVLDPVSADHFDIYRQARDLWPEFAAGLGQPELVRRCGAMWVALDAAGLEHMLARLEAVGAQARRISPEEAARLCPGVTAPVGAIHTDEDWRLEPPAALAALRAAFVDGGGLVRTAALEAFADGRAQLSDGAIAADRVILASGLAPVGWPDPAPELAALVPIRGQILRAVGAGPSDGPVVRGMGIYVVPGEAGAWLGATMETGRSDRVIDSETSARLSRAAAGLIPALASAGISAEAGVRGATPDGLPLVGMSARPGVILALGARRNGWLLAPTIAAAVVEVLGGGAAPARLAARRFDPIPTGRG